MPKKHIVMITGKSGSGKSTVARWIEGIYGVPMVKSYTTRPKRSSHNTDHTYITDSEMLDFSVEDILGYTEFGGYKYACKHSDISAVSVYVISEDTMEHIKNNYSDKYDITTIRLKRPLHLREESVGTERILRDAGRFYLPDTYFDYAFNANTLRELKGVVRKMTNNTNLGMILGQYRGVV